MPHSALIHKDACGLWTLFTGSQVASTRHISSFLSTTSHTQFLSKTAFYWILKDNSLFSRHSIFFVFRYLSYCILLYFPLLKGLSEFPSLGWRDQSFSKIHNCVCVRNTSFVLHLRWHLEVHTYFCFDIETSRRYI